MYVSGWVVSAWLGAVMLVVTYGFIVNVLAVDVCHCAGWGGGGGYYVVRMVFTFTSDEWTGGGHMEMEL